MPLICNHHLFSRGRRNHLDFKTVSKNIRVSQTRKVRSLRASRPPPIALVGAPAPYVDPTLLAKLVRATIKGITSVSAPIATTPTDNVVVLVWIIKSLREMGCEPFLREQDTEIVGR